MSCCHVLLQALLHHLYHSLYPVIVLWIPWASCDVVTAVLVCKCFELFDENCGSLPDITIFGPLYSLKNCFITSIVGLFVVLVLLMIENWLQWSVIRRYLVDSNSKKSAPIFLQGPCGTSGNHLISSQEQLS